ncbi:hypothetical protein AAZX31_11G153900 [Glycine max]|nr:hypothetical protein GLYMA_11G177419v4 [Glycine max]KAH1115781.1 hypothetical protein GYH30_057082 [Glycine max]KAH1225158.1 hypothetical protein GmHk_11G032132 [Glycine max]|eukprot:XP_014628565.2 uncharacterized protein LOC106797838 [Glycine max]
MGCTLTYQFVVAFHTDRNLIEIPSIYQKQWVPHYPSKVLFAYNGSSYIIKVIKIDDKYFFADGLKEFRKALNIQEGIIIIYAASERDWIFNLHFMPPLDNQTCGRPPATRITHVWTIELTEAMISAPRPLVLPMNALRYVDVTRKNMFVLINDDHPLLWKLTMHDA